MPKRHPIPLHVTRLGHAAGLQGDSTIFSIMGLSIYCASAVKCPRRIQSYDPPARDPFAFAGQCFCLAYVVHTYAWAGYRFKLLWSSVCASRWRRLAATVHVRCERGRGTKATCTSTANTNKYLSKCLESCLRLCVLRWTPRPQVAGGASPRIPHASDAQHGRHPGKGICRGSGPLRLASRPRNSQPKRPPASGMHTATRTTFE